MVEKTILTILFLLVWRREIRNRAIVRQIFFIWLRCCSSGLIIDDFKVERKVSEVMERFTIKRIVGYISLKILFSTVVRRGSRSQYESDSKLSISSKVAGVNEWIR